MEDMVLKRIRIAVIVHAFPLVYVYVMLNQLQCVIIISH